MYACVTRLLPLVCMALIGCASGTVGPRAGIDIPLDGGSNSVAVVGGATVEARLATIGVRVDPQVRMFGSDDEATAVVGQEAVVTASLSTRTSVLDLPVMIVIGKERPDAAWRSFLHLGAMLSYPVTQSVISSTSTTASTPQGAITVAQYNRSGTSHIDDAWFSLLACGGARYMLSKQWELRGEARVQYLLTEDPLGSYAITGPNGSTLISVTNTLPSLSLGLHISLLMRL